MFIFQGPPGTRGPEGRQGEKGSKVRLCKLKEIQLQQISRLSGVFFCPHVICYFRGIQVPLALQERPAPWGHRVNQENQELRV